MRVPFASVLVVLLIMGLAPLSTVRVVAQSSIIPIGTVQGPVGDTADGRTVRSPFAPATGNSAGSTTVMVQAVVYEKTLARTGAGGSQFGFFIQNTPATADADPTTSDGIFVFIGGFSTVLNATPGGPLYTPTVGDEVVLSGRITEFFFLTELTSPRFVGLVRSGVNLDAKVPAFAVRPPDGLADAGRYWERHEGMRALVPAHSLVVGKRDVFASTMDGEVWVIRPDHPVARRRDQYAQRVFRDPHPLDDLDADQLFDNGNGFRIIMGSLGIKATANDRNALIAPARTYDRMVNPAVGGVYFSFNKYQIMIGLQLRLRAGADPSGNAPVPSYDRTVEYRIASFNVENLYDFRDDPTDGCDFAGNAGCPGVNPPFDYVPASQSVYEQKLNDLADQIITDLGSPDVVLIQEIEDQDICHVTVTGLVCGGAASGDGKPDPLQDLALVIAGKGGPAYDSAYDRDGADDRGIINAFFYRTDSAELLPPSAADPVLGSSPQVEYRGAALGYNAEVQNPKALNADLPSDVDLSTGVDGSNVFTRPPQVGLFRISRLGTGTGVFTDLYLVSNHFSSGPNTRVGQRTEQAAYNGAIVAALKAANLQVKVVVGGDFNVYPRPDDPFAPGDARFPSDQLGALYDEGLLNLWDTLLAQRPSAAYSYVFEGQTQTLDQIFVTPSIFGTLRRVWAAHVNSDWPADFDGDSARGISDHDPQGADFVLQSPGP